ncbi:c-type cytochrome biogenesis protein CcmI [Agarilytica rhodophyticola]|uniref:c-type cytochrome biogenesis protein CcmI n=1 Tax=Agarilytica rhodophyticola TaxID=1737490 RepID=UPI000B346A2B|nr:c-type cytochrome biogenesis protein CcmI [Agarilytica rhodophyticola]
MEFWQVYILINILAAIFIVWPAIFVAKKYKKDLRANARTETNTEVFEGHFAELEQTYNRGEISEAEMTGLKRDLEKTLIEENHMALDDSERPVVSSFKSRIPVLSLVLALPILSLILYSSLGSKKDWEIYQLAINRGGETPEVSKERANELILALQDRVNEKPENAQNWYLLATVSIEQGIYEEGVRAFREVLNIQPNAPKVQAELAQALFLRAGNTITPEVREHTKAALAAAPNMPTALGLAGIDAYQTGNYKNAMDFWQRALVQLDPQSAAARALTGGIARAKLALDKTGDTQQVAQNTETTAPALHVKVSVDKQNVQVSDDDFVFVYARAWQGPRMPLAIQKVKVSDLPLEVKLDQSMSMTQGMDLASFPQVEVVARISSTGSAISQPGDWQAAFGPVIVASQNTPIDLKISEKIPEK